MREYRRRRVPNALCVDVSTGHKAVLRRWEHLLNTPSAAITDERDHQIGPKSPFGGSNPEQKPQKPAYQNLPS